MNRFGLPLAALLVLWFGAAEASQQGQTAAFNWKAADKCAKQAQGSDIVQIVLAFDEALGGVMKDIVLWTVRNPALSRKRRPL